MTALKRILQTLLDPRSRLERSGPGKDGGARGAAPAGARGRIKLGDLVFNLPLVGGLLIVLGLFVIVLFGPVWAPFNPYISGQHIVAHFDARTNQWIAPPLDPSPDFPLGTDQWGNDILSMLMHGARNTLVACAFVTMIRVVVGLVLGAVAGWNENKEIDHLIMGTAGVLNSLPMLISSMMLVFALDIRRGLPVFIVALSLIGWTEVAQYVRSEFLVLRKMPYIEGARAVGTRNLAIAVRHVLPNLLPQLLVIAFLEMGAVLMLLGELSFVGVFIGGGSQIAVGDELVGTNLVTLVQVPEWGAMLADGYQWLRSKPFMVFPPAIAFMVAVIGFNALGEGLRRLLEQKHLNTAFLLSKRMLVFAGALTMMTVFIINNTGAAPWFARVAQAYNGDGAYRALEELTAMDGRGVGQAGGQLAASYLAEKFQEYGLDPGWKGQQYLYIYETTLVRPVSQPQLEILPANGGSGRVFQHQLDFGYLLDGHAGAGTAEQGLRFVGFDPRTWDNDWSSYQGLDLRDRIALVVADNAPADFANEALIRGARGVLWLVEDGPAAVRSQVQLAGGTADHLQQPTMPVFRVQRSALDGLLAGVDRPLETLFSAQSEHDVGGRGWYAVDLPLVARMSLDLGEPAVVRVPCVLGYKPGSDFNLAKQMVVLFAHYDGLGIDPDGTVFPGANHNASGAGVLLELARLWQEQNLDNRRAVLFVVWGGLNLSEPGARDFLQSASSFRHLPAPSSNGVLAPAVIIQLDRLGTGGESLVLAPTSSQRLARLLDSAGLEVGVQVLPEGAQIPAAESVRISGAQYVGLQWSGEAPLPNEDTIEAIEREKLQSVGELLSLTLTRLVRQTSY